MFWVCAQVDVLNGRKLSMCAPNQLPIAWLPFSIFILLRSRLSGGGRGGISPPALEYLVYGSYHVDVVQHEWHTQVLFCSTLRSSCVTTYDISWHPLSYATTRTVGEEAQLWCSSPTQKVCGAATSGRKGSTVGWCRVAFHSADVIWW